MEFVAFVCLAVVAGLVSFTSPCTLPLLPGYVSYVSGLSHSPGAEDEMAARSARRRTVLGAALFVSGFTLVFSALGASATALGFLLARHQRLLNIVSGAVIIVMGAATIGVVRLPWLYRQVRFDLGRFGRGPAGALPMGAAFAFGWTPCVGPVLASILATAASTATLAPGTVLLVAYSLGLGLPFLLLAFAMSRGRLRLTWLRRHARHIEIAGGAVLVAMGVALLTGGWTALMSWALSGYARLGWPPI